MNQFTGSLYTTLEALPSCWQGVFAQAPVQQALRQLEAFLSARLAAQAVIYPSQPFKVLHQLPLEHVQVVVLGQDPYHGPGQAQGLAFSVPNTVPAPPSLRNIFTELAQEYPDDYRAQQADLTRWVKQGVLLLNTTLTVEQGKAGSHAGKGWELVSDAIIEAVAKQGKPTVFMLWGRHAQAKKRLLQPATVSSPLLILEANHPSPLSARRAPMPFIGCGHFKKTNQWLRQQGRPGVNWLAHEASN